MRVTAVTPVDKRKCKVFLEEEDFAFPLYRGEVERFHIQEGSELPETVYLRILEEILVPRAKERALYLLQAQGRTGAQMETKLSGYNFRFIFWKNISHFSSSITLLFSIITSINFQQSFHISHSLNI